MHNNIFNTVCRAILVSVLPLALTNVKADQPTEAYPIEAEDALALQSWNSLEIDGEFTDSMVSMFERQERIYTTVFQEPFVGERDGMLELIEAPAAGLLTYCLRGEESCAFYVEQYDDYNINGLLWLARDGSEEILDRLLDFEARFTLGWATGLLISESGEATTSGLTIGIKQNDGGIVYVMLPLHPSDRAWFLPPALTWIVAGGLEEGDLPIAPLFPDYCDFTGGAAHVDDCDALYDNEQCVNYASCVCGDEPSCDPSPQYPGIQECMRSAHCRDAKCDWAHCMNTHEMSCEHWYAIGVKQSLACAALHITELTLCLPSPIVDLVKSQA